MYSGPRASTPTLCPSFQCVWLPNLSRAITLTRISSPAATTQVSPCLPAPTTATSHIVGSAWPDSNVRSNTPPGSGNIVLPPNTPPMRRGSIRAIPPSCFSDEFFSALSACARDPSFVAEPAPPRRSPPFRGSDRSSVSTKATGSSSTNTPSEYTPATEAVYRSSQLPLPSSSVSHVTSPGPVPCPARDASPSLRGTLFPNLSIRVTVIASGVPAIHRLCRAPSQRHRV
mmetsp:Transcript_10184/g.46118  ORF Transcript_10184/g.46118 Transcript_10184/m.46118 type:complete len:229 (+) Transcript_10184:2586-3272(+)